MIKILKYILPFFLLVVVTTGYSQNNEEEARPVFMVRGFVVEDKTNKPISKVNIEVNGGDYTTTNIQGEFKIQVRKGDEIVIKHSDFETVYYTIKNNERITVRVEPNGVLSLISSRSNQSEKIQGYNALIDSADVYLKQDAAKSIEFLGEALASSTSTKQNGEIYEILGDVYFHWKQFDLSVTNYRISLQNIASNDTKLKLAKAYHFNNNYQESIDLYNSITKSQLSNWQRISLHEGLGDVSAATKDHKTALTHYQDGLLVAKKHLITPKITDLNSKIAQTHDAIGNIEEAEDYYGNSLQLAKQENKTRAVKEKVADFKNKKRDYVDEIKLREEVLNELQDIELDSIDKSTMLTPQKQNYKIGNAYYLQKDFENAIPYLDKSIELAKENDDIEVEKDATRKLSEVLNEAGDSEQALAATKSYERLVDELYIKKEQDIILASRLRENLSNSQTRITSLESDRALSTTQFELSQEQNKRQRLIIYSLIGGLLLFLIAGYFMYKSIKQQKLANNLLALKSLRSQMNPHFIFNALNSVNSFIASSDERTANKYLTDFSLLMRAVLENSEEDFIPLEKEIELLELYTKLEHFRFQDKFDYTISIADDVNVDEFQIPPMLLQPYIENAVWHGLRYKTKKGSLHIIVSQSAKDEIHITIADDGIGREKSKAMKTQNQKKHNSKGLGNIKKRVAILNEMYKDKVDVFIDDFQDENDTGTKVVVTLKKD